MQNPLRNVVYEKIVNSRGKSMLDTELLESLRKDGYDVRMKDLNRVLLQLEILGLISVRWVSKDKRRVELSAKPHQTPHTIW